MPLVALAKWGNKRFSVQTGDFLFCATMNVEIRIEVMIMKSNKVDLIERLKVILDEHSDKRIVVVGTTCTGKSTLLKEIDGTHDMDELVFPLLTKEESDFVCSVPWTEEIGQTMIRLTKERVEVKAGEPVFGTVVLESDLIVYLKISDALLRERTGARNAHFEDAKNMQRQIEGEIIKRGVPVIEFDVG